MNKKQKAILVMASRCLDYPTVELLNMKPDFQEIIENVFEGDNEIKEAFLPLFRFTIREIQELYVETFDLKSKINLYLTAHELGDSNRRGAALVKLQKMINQAGFERNSEELVDYIPMLLEFLTVAPKHVELERLKRRLSVVLTYILENLNKNNPYAGIFKMLMKYVFTTPTAEEVKQLELGREEADLEELPYPIMYK